MKKDYMKPEGVVVAICVNENISTSRCGSEDAFLVHYGKDSEGKRVINDSNVPACEVGTEDQRRIIDLLNCMAYGLSNCCEDI
jgi:hypothetical protein